MSQSIKIGVEVDVGGATRSASQLEGALMRAAAGYEKLVTAQARFGPARTIALIVA